MNYCVILLFVKIIMPAKIEMGLVY